MMLFVFGMPKEEHLLARQNSWQAEVGGCFLLQVSIRVAASVRLSE
jgi:hypothetical protein